MIAMKPIHTLYGILFLIAIIITPSAFAQVTYTDSNNPAGPLMMPAWVIGLAVAGAASGLGIWTIARRH